MNENLKFKQDNNADVSAGARYSAHLTLSRAQSVARLVNNFRNVERDCTQRNLTTLAAPVNS